MSVLVLDGSHMLCVVVLPSCFLLRKGGAFDGQAKWARYFSAIFYVNDSTRFLVEKGRKF